MKAYATDDGYASTIKRGGAIVLCASITVTSLQIYISERFLASTCAGALVLQEADPVLRNLKAVAA